MLEAETKIIELSPSIYCKSRDELSNLDKLIISQRGINSLRYHRYIGCNSTSIMVSLVFSIGKQEMHYILDKFIR